MGKQTFWLLTEVRGKLFFNVLITFFFFKVMFVLGFGKCQQFSLFYSLPLFPSASMFKGNFRTVFKIRF